MNHYSVNENGVPLVDIDAGFEVAPGSIIDIEVVNAHRWGSGAMVFSSGRYTWTANNFVSGDAHLSAGASVGFLQSDAAGRVSAQFGCWDVLLRKRV